jgi:hypothetical protein
MSNEMDYDKPLIHLQGNDNGSYVLFIGVLLALIFVIMFIAFGLPQRRRNEIISDFQGLSFKAGVTENINK